MGKGGKPVNTGKVIDIENNTALVMTDDFVFTYIRARSGIEIGHKLTFCEDDIIRSARKFPVYAAIAAGLAAVITIVLVFLQLNIWKNDIYAYICVDINPSIELSIDKNDRIAEAKPLNSDARALLNGINLSKMSVSDALEIIIDRSDNRGFLNTESENMVLISASLNKNAKPNALKKLENVINTINRQAKDHRGKNISVEIIRIEPEECEVSRKNDISMGRYALYSRARENGVDLSIEEAKNIDVLSAWRELYLDVGNKIAGSTAAPFGTDTGESNVTTAAVTPTVIVTYTSAATQTHDINAGTKTTPAWRDYTNTQVLQETVPPVQVETTPPVQNKTPPRVQYHITPPVYPIATMPRITDRPKPMQINLLKNPGFESGNAMFWWIANFSYWVVTKEERHSGKYSIKLSGDGDKCALTQANIWLFPNTDYVFSFYAKSKPDSKVNFSIEEEVGGTPITETREITANDTWIKYSTSFNSGHYTRVRINLEDGGGEAYFDDFSLVNQIKTPGT